MKLQFVSCLLLILAALVPSTAFAAYEGGSEPFAFGHQDGIEVPRMYSSVVTLNADSASTTDFIFRTQNTSADGDPVMLLLDNSTGEPIAIEDDDFYTEFVPIGLIVPRNPELTLTLDPGESRTVRVVVASFDEDFSGQTDVVIMEEVGSLEPKEYFRVNGVRFGSVTVHASWQAGDVVQTVGHYESRTLEEACENELQGDWDFTTRECNDDGTWYGPSMTCERAYPNKRLRFNAVYTHGSRCESSTLAKDTILFAAEGWSKQPELVSVWDPFTFTYVTEERARTQSTDNGGFNEDGWYGNNARLEMPAASDDYSAIVVGLHPWNDRYSTRSLSAFFAPDSPIERDKLRVYRDHALSLTTDGDLDGISSDLEDIIGSTSNDSDSDDDGLIDGLEVYGTLDVPFPALGTNPVRRTVILEVDRQTGVEITSQRHESMRAASYAVDESEVDLIMLTGNPATYTVEECHLERGYLDPYTWVCEPAEEPAVPVINQMPRIPTTSETGDIGQGEQGLDGGVMQCTDLCLIDDSYAGFDLKGLPFARRITWIAYPGGHAVPPGRWAKAGSPGAGFLHEVGHLMGLHHGGADTIDSDQPNYWSVMRSGYASFEVWLPSYGKVRIYSVHQLLHIGRAASGRMRFSSGRIAALDEAALDEEAGLSNGECLDDECTDYQNPLLLEGVLPPDKVMEIENDPATSFSNMEIGHFTDLEVGWNDFNTNDRLDDGSYGKNIDYSCRQVGSEWKNLRTNVQGAKSVCFDNFEVNNDIDYLNNGDWYDYTYLYADHSNGNFDTQRNAMGLPDWQDVPGQ